MIQNLALIPARKNSKRLPGKNMRDFLGKPLIQWTIDLAMESKGIDEIIVSSDSDEILEFSKFLGVRYCHKRSEANSGDFASMQSVISESIEYFETLTKEQVQVLTLLQVTSPLRNSGDLNNAIEVIKNDSTIDCVVSFTHRPSSLSDNKLMAINKEGLISIDSINTELPEQSLGVVMRNGPAICISRLPKAKESLYHGRVKGIEMPWLRSIDIDTQDDFNLAELIAKFTLNE